MENTRLVVSLANDFKEPTKHAATMTVYFTLEEMLVDKEALILKLSVEMSDKLRGYVNVVDSNLVRA